MNDHYLLVKSAFFGHAVGDALGVPFEYKSRETILKNPATDMAGYGTYNLPPGTFSDDSSLFFCLTESLIPGINLYDFGNKMVDRFTKGYWAPHGVVFDIGITTRRAIENIKKGLPADLAGSFAVDLGRNDSNLFLIDLKLLISL